VVAVVRGVDLRGETPTEELDAAPPQPATNRPAVTTKAATAPGHDRDGGCPRTLTA
jgi:hypothetical protein